jgi:hypothetical protein
VVNVLAPDHRSQDGAPQRDLRHTKDAGRDATSQRIGTLLPNRIAHFLRT